MRPLFKEEDMKLKEIAYYPIYVLIQNEVMLKEIQGDCCQSGHVKRVVGDSQPSP